MKIELKRPILPPPQELVMTLDTGEIQLLGHIICGLEFNGTVSCTAFKREELEAFAQKLRHKMIEEGIDFIGAKAARDAARARRI